MIRISSLCFLVFFNFGFIFASFSQEFQCHEVLADSARPPFHFLIAERNAGLRVDITQGVDFNSAEPVAYRFVTKKVSDNDDQLIFENNF